MKKILVSIFIILNLVTYSEGDRELNIKKMNFKDGLIYAENEQSPFTGTFVNYYESGQIWVKASYKEGKLDGERIFYYENGNIKAKNNYKSGKRDKEQIFYSENGKTNLKINYKNGIEVGEAVYHNDDIHTVVKGDTLYSISKRYNITLDNLKEINNLEIDKIKLGKKLKISINNSGDHKKSEADISTEKFQKENTFDDDLSQEKLLSSTGKELEEYDRNPNNTGTHTVVKGDTIYNISKKYNITSDKLKEINNLKTNKIELGQQLIILK